MKMKVVKIFSLFMIITLIMITLSACSSKKKDSSNNAAAPGSKSESYNSGMYYDTSVADMDSNAESPMQPQDYDGGENTLVELEENEVQFHTEEYNTIVENSFQSVKNYPLSTFSVDVDTASYSNIRRMIYDYNYVEPDAVRIEEMINYFKYDYKKPTGDVPFAVTTEISHCPWNDNAKLLLIGLQAEDIDFDDRPSSNLVFLLDVSGSMNSPDKLPLMQKAFIMLTENLNKNDRISIVTYAGQESVVLEGASGDDTFKIVNAIENLMAGGSTAGAAGIETAYKIAEKYFIRDGNNRVILATDGDLNVGITSEGALTRLIEKKREKGVFLSVLGFGTGNIKDNKMEALADNGNGNYAYIDSILEAKKVLVEEMGGTLFTVAKDVKLQVEFNPEKIKGYRLIGYENRMLATEDFEDDTKDAGEIGAGHRVTALYELLEIDSKQEISETDLKYQTESSLKGNEEWLTVNIRYKEPNQDKSQLISHPVDESMYTEEMPENLTFASSVAAFGMVLRESKWKGDASYDVILNQLDRLDLSEDEYKDEFVSLVKTMKRIK